MTNLVVEITDTQNFEDFVVYIISVSTVHANWSIRRRYSEFADLHNVLCLSFGEVIGTKLTGKKYIGNFSKGFVDKRKLKLENYLKTVISNLPYIPRELGHFLELHKYEPNWIVYTLCESIHHLEEDAPFSACFLLDTLQLHSVHMRMCLRIVPDQEEPDEKLRVDMANLMEFLYNLRILKVDGKKHRSGTSNWQLDALPFSLSFFKSVKHLQMESVNLLMLEQDSLHGLQDTVVNLHCHQSLENCADLLNPCRHALPNKWEKIVRLNLSRNNLECIDESIYLVPNLHFLDLSHNKISQITDFSHMCNLRELDLSHNKLSSLEDLHIKVGNISKLFLDHNKLFSLNGLQKVFSLRELSCTNNRINDLEDVMCLGDMPCLEVLFLKDNPLCSVLDYRSKVLEIFMERAPEVTLDGIVSTVKELDTVRVLVALHKARVGAIEVSTPRSSNTIRRNVSSGSIHRSSSLEQNSNIDDSGDRIDGGWTNDDFDSIQPRSFQQPSEPFSPHSMVMDIKASLMVALSGTSSRLDWKKMLQSKTPDGVSQSLVSLLTSNVRSRSDCSELFALISAQEDNEDPSLKSLDAFLKLLTDYFNDPDPFSVVSVDESGMFQEVPLNKASEFKVAQDDYPSSVLWKSILTANNSAIESLRLTDGFLALCRSDRSKFISAVHERLICVSPEEEPISQVIWGSIMLKSMTFPKMSVMIITSKHIRVFFDSSGRSENRSDELTSKDQGIGQYIGNLYIGACVELSSVENCEVNCTNQSAKLIFNSVKLPYHNEMLFITCDSIQNSQLCSALPCSTEKTKSNGDICSELDCKKVLFSCLLSKLTSDPSTTNDRTWFKLVAITDEHIAFRDDHLCLSSSKTNDSWSAFLLSAISSVKLESDHPVVVSIRNQQGAEEPELSIDENFFGGSESHPKPSRLSVNSNQFTLKFRLGRDREKFLLVLKSIYGDLTGKPLATSRPMK